MLLTILYCLLLANSNEDRFRLFPDYFGGACYVIVLRLLGQRGVGKFFTRATDGRVGIRQAECRGLFTAVTGGGPASASAAAHHRSLLLTRLRIHRRDATQSQVVAYQRCCFSQRMNQPIKTHQHSAVCRAVA